MNIILQYIILAATQFEKNAWGVIYSLLLNIDAIGYTLVSEIYKVFLLLSRVRLESESLISGLIRRIYVLMGTIMLFMLAYSLLRSIVSPDGKMKDTGGKMVLGVAKAIILIAIVPTIFDFAYKFQHAIISENTIGKIIIGNAIIGTETTGNVVEDGGMTMGVGVLSAFIFPTGVLDVDGNTITADTPFRTSPSLTLNQLFAIIRSDGNFWNLDLAADELAQKVEDDTDKKPVIGYYFFLSFLASLYMGYLLITYCLALGSRIIKLMFLEVIAPVPILMGILPSKKDMLGKWVKVTMTSFVEVFVRIAILYLVIYVITLVHGSMNNIYILSGSGGFQYFAEYESAMRLVGLIKAILILGLITFAKQAPKLLSEVTGIDSSNMKLGIRDQLAAGGFFTAGAIVGGAISAGTKNLVGGLAGSREKWKKAGDLTDKKERMRARGGAIWSGISSFGRGAAGAVSGGFRSYNKDAKDFTSMKDSAKKGSSAAVYKAAKRAGYKKEHGETIRGAIGGHVTDFGMKAKGFLGLNGVEDLQKENQVYSNVGAAIKKVKNEAFSLIDDEVAKNSDFTIKLKIDKDSLDYSAKELNRRKAYYENIQNAGRNPGEDIAAYNDRLINARDEYEKYRADFAKAIQKTALLQSNQYDTLIDNTELKATLSGVRIAAEDLRTTIKSNLTDSEVGKRFDAEKVNLNINLDDVKHLSDDIKIKSAENQSKINEYNREIEKRQDKKDK